MTYRKTSSFLFPRHIRKRLRFRSCKARSGVPRACKILQTGVCVAVAWMCLVAGADTAYELGPATELLDAAFYAGEAADGSNLAGRMAFFGGASNDGTTVAFWAVNIATSMKAVFLVDIGAPSSWIRLTQDFSGPPDGPIYWSPDDLSVWASGYRIPLATGTLLTETIHGYPVTEDANPTRLPTGNWLLSYVPPQTTSGDIVALPILATGQEDVTRQPVIVTQLYGTGVGIEWPHIAADGSAVAFMDYQGPPDAVQADVCDIYVIENLPTIMGAPKAPGTDISTLAPSSLGDPNVAPIRTSETTNFTATPYFSQDLSLVFYSEDWNNVFRDDDFFATLTLADFDVMVSNADGSGLDFRVQETGNQGVVIPTQGGVRLTYIAEVGGIFHLYISTLVVETDVTGTDQGNNDILTTTDQTASDASGTVVEVPSGTTIDFPAGEPQTIQISTPIDPATDPELPAGVEAIPVIRVFGPDGAQFSPPITITISYTDAEVAGLDEINLRVVLFNEISGMYDIEITTIVNRDLVNNTISFTVDHFSKFGLGTLRDTDSDGIPDLSDDDDDNDGIPDVSDANPLDTDNDGTDNADDPDDDGDGIPDGDDTHPFDTDNDGLHNGIDDDDDGDGIDDTIDLFLLDTDNDGLRNDVDDDDDNDGVSDDDERASGTDPLDPNSYPPRAVPLNPAVSLLALLLVASALMYRRMRNGRVET